MSQKNILRLEAVTRQSGFPVTGRVRGFDVTVDEPASLGGTDRAPNPIEYLVVAQASCLSIVLKALAEKKRLDLKEVVVEAQSSFDLEGFLKGEAVGLREIDLTVKVNSGENTDTLEKLLREAEKICPVKNTLSAKVKTKIQKL